MSVKWIQAIIALAFMMAAAYLVTFALTASIARLFDLLGRFVAMPWRCGAPVRRPSDVHHRPVRLVLAVAVLFLVVLCTPFAAEHLGPRALISQRLFYGALLFAFAEWLEDRSARPAAWVSYGGMTLYAFIFGANAGAHVTLPAIFDAFACIGLLLLAQRAARDDDRARRSAAVIA